MENNYGSSMDRVLEMKSGNRGVDYRLDAMQAALDAMAPRPYTGRRVEIVTSIGPDGRRQAIPTLMKD